MPVRVVGIVLEFQRHLVVGIAFGIEVVGHIPAEHAPVDNPTTRRCGTVVDIISRHLQISAIRFVVLALKILVNMFVNTHTLHILVKEE